MSEWCGAASITFTNASADRARLVCKDEDGTAGDCDCELAPDEERVVRFTGEQGKWFGYRWTLENRRTGEIRQGSAADPVWQVFIEDAGADSGDMTGTRFVRWD